MYIVWKCCSCYFREMILLRSLPRTLPPTASNILTESEAAMPPDFYLPSPNLNIAQPQPPPDYDTAIKSGSHYGLPPPPTYDEAMKMAQSATDEKNRISTTCRESQNRGQTPTATIDVV